MRRRLRLDKRVMRFMNDLQIRVSALLIALAFVGAIAHVCVGQTPKPTPVEAPPKQPTFELPARPMPDATRVGVSTGSEKALTLAEAIEMALKNNNDIDLSRNDTEIADLGIMRAKGAWDPLISSESYYESVSTPTASAIGGAVNGSVTQRRILGTGSFSGLSPIGGGSYSATLTGSRTTTSNTNSFLNPQYPTSAVFQYVQPLWRGRKIDASRRQLKVANKTLQLNNAQLEQKAMDIVAAVEQAYWDLSYALRNQQVQTDSLLQAREQLESNKRLVAKGVLAPIEIVAAQAQIAQFERSVYSAKETVTRAENNLKTLLLPDRNDAEWSRPLTPTTPVTNAAPQIGLEVAMSEALKNRPELEQIEVTADINRIDQTFYKDQTKPQINIVGSYTTNGLAGTETAAAINPSTGLSRVPPNLVGGLGSSLTNLLQQDYPTYRAGVQISLPLRNRVAKANYGQTLVEAKRIDNLRDQAEQAIEAEVRNSLQALRSAEASLASANAQRIAAEELYNSEQRQFRAGATTFYLVLQRQTDLLVARGAEIQSQTDLNKAISIFNRAIGKTLEINNVDIGR